MTFAASFVPAFVGGMALSGLADRLPRQRVMIACDLIRVVLVAVMAVSGIPVAVLVALLFVVTMIGAPFLSARAALYPDILTGDLYVLGTAVTLITLQFAQVLGFAVGGAVVGFFGFSASLLIDAATFAISALITCIWVRSRPAAQPAADRGSGARGGLLAGLRLVFGQPSSIGIRSAGWPNTSRRPASRPSRAPDPRFTAGLAAAQDRTQMQVIRAEMANVAASISSDTRNPKKATTAPPTANPST